MKYIQKHFQEKIDGWIKFFSKKSVELLDLHINIINNCWNYIFCFMEIIL
jgi:hypothetical protein